MFIRVKKIKLKNGKISEIYQAVKSYRSDGKVKQKVVALGKHKSVREALAEIEMILIGIVKNLQVPLEEYKTRTRSAKRIRARLENDFEKFKEIRLKLIDIEQDNNDDTTKIIKVMSKEY